MSRTVIARPALTGIACLALSACATVSHLPTQPFHDYHASVVQLSASADQALAAEQRLSHQRFAEAAGSTGELGRLQLQPDLEGSVFDLKLSEVPISQEIQHARSNLAALHSSVEAYAELLQVLAAPGDSSAAIDAETVATELRTNAISLAETIGAGATLKNDWFFGFGVLAEEYVESKRRDLLVELLQSADDEMRAFAELGQQIVMISAAGIQTEYAASYSKRTQGADDLNEKQTQKLVVEILALNAQTLRQLELLKQLHNAYGALPGAHQQLQQAVASGSTLSASALLIYAESLRDKYQSFSKE